MYYGEKNTLSASEYWLGHVDIIHCICEELRIKHISLLQPCAFSGGYEYSETEKSALAASYSLTEAEIESYCADFQKTYKSAIQGAKNRSYIADISDLFNADDNVYIDACHVREEYTSKIAEAIYKKLSEY